MRELEGTSVQTFERPAELPLLLSYASDETLQRFMEVPTFNELLDGSPYSNDGHHEDLHLRTPL